MTKLSCPHVTDYIFYDDYREVISAIKSMVVRGAPALALAGAYAVCLAVKELATGELEYSHNVSEKIKGIIIDIGDARPTAVNLSIAMTAMSQSLSACRSCTSLRDVFIFYL